MFRRNPTRRPSDVLNGDGHVVGLDIGATGVRAAAITPVLVDGRPAATLAGLGQVDLPPGAVMNGVVQDEAVVTEAVKQLWREGGFSCKSVVLGIASQQVVVRELQMPNLEPAQRAKALPYQAKEVVALPIDEVVLDYCPIGEPDPATDLVHGLLVAIPREPVLSAVYAVERAGLKVARVDLSSFATLRAAGDDLHAAEAVVDLGAHLSTIVVHHEGVPRLVRTLTRGGDQLTDQVADRMGVEPHEAEQLKRQHGLAGDHDEVSRALVEGLRPLISEIRTSLAYFRTTRDTTIERIALTGGGAQLGGIAQAVTDQVGVPARVVDPLQHTGDGTVVEPIRAGLLVPPSAVSVGLAMGAAA